MKLLIMQFSHASNYSFPNAPVLEYEFAMIQAKVGICELHAICTSSVYSSAEFEFSLVFLHKTPCNM
jgi:hypothetical protein